MNASIQTSNSLDKNYLLRLLQGNNEMMGVVLKEIVQTLPKCLAEISSCISLNDTLGVVTYSLRAKSAFFILREDRLVESFQKMEDFARKGEMSSVQNLFTAELNNTLVKLELIEEAV